MTEMWAWAVLGGLMWLFLAVVICALNHGANAYKRGR